VERKAAESQKTSDVRCFLFSGETWFQSFAAFEGGTSRAELALLCAAADVPDDAPGAAL